MNFTQHHKLGIAVAALGLFFLSQFLFIKLNGQNVEAPNIPREPLVKGSGPALNYLVLGDSTSIAQGADYQAGVAITSSNHLAEKYTVTMRNLGVSGARAKDVEKLQLPKVDFKPDLVIIMVGANDVTHLTSKGSLAKSLNSTISQLIAKNCNVKIVLTGAAQMGSVSRFPQPLRAVAGQQTKSVNHVFGQVAAQQKVTLAPLAEETGRIFANDSSLFAKDNFHPNERGYAVWNKVLIPYIDKAFDQASHCSAN